MKPYLLDSNVLIYAANGLPGRCFASATASCNGLYAI
jgi:hypothetical protein